MRLAQAPGHTDTAATRRAALDAMLASFELLPFDRLAAKHSARIRAAGLAQGRRFGPLDALIAGTAVAHDLPLYTQDSAFAAMEGVDVRLV